MLLSRAIINWECCAVLCCVLGVIERAILSEQLIPFDKLIVRSGEPHAWLQWWLAAEKKEIVAAYD